MEDGKEFNIKFSKLGRDFHARWSVACGVADGRTAILGVVVLAWGAVTVLLEFVGGVVAGSELVVALDRAFA